MRRTLTSAVVALVLAGCGGGGEPEKTRDPGTEREAPKRSTGEPSTARFIEKADEICARFYDRWVGVPEATSEYYRDWERSNADLEALNAPARISTEWNRYLSALEQQLRFSKAENGVALKQAYERKEKAAQEIGFADCGSR